VTDATGHTARVPLAVLLLLGVVGSAVAALEVPFLSGRVNDYAGMIDPEAEERIASKLEELEARRGSQIAVLTIETLAGEVVEEFSHRVAETWALGSEQEDDGVLLLVARRERKMRIEVGYGLEAELTDAESGRILRRVLAPRFQNGDLSGGIEAGVDAIITTLDGVEALPVEAVSDRKQPLAMVLGVGMAFLVVIGLFSLQALFAASGQSWFLYVLLMPFWYAFPAALVKPRAGALCVALWVVAFPLLKHLLGTRAGKRWRRTRRHWMGDSTGGGWHSNGWGGGSSSGGFSGGGGSFGGGGASGSW